MQDLGAISDGQWHQYVATFNTKTACFYMDGQLVSQNWLTNDIGQIGPQNLTSGSPATASTPTAITYSAIGGFGSNSDSGISDVRISNTALTPAQVKRNFENYRSFTNIWYASPSGLSTNAGTQSSPFDLATALTHATTDNEIILLPGTYNGAQFDVTTGGISPLDDVVISGANYTAGTAGQAIIQTTGSTQGALISDGAEYVTLQNLTFSSDQSVALAFSGVGRGNVVDSCRITSNVGGMTVTNSPGYQDQLPSSADGNGSSGQHYIIVPAVTLENSVIAAGSGATAVSYAGSPTVILRNNTIEGGAIGASFTSATTDISLLDNIFDNQTSANVYFGSNCVEESVNSDGSAMPAYEGDGNMYNPASGGYVGTAAGTNFATLDSFAEFWYVLQYSTTNGGSPITSLSSGPGIGTRSDQYSVQAVPTFVSTAGGDFRLAPIQGNLIGTGAAQIYDRIQAGGYPTVWDGLGAARTQGNIIDAGAFETLPPTSATFTLTTAGSTSAGVYDANGNLVRTLWSGVQEAAGSVTAYWNGLETNNTPAPAGNYTIKLLSNNVEYVCDGSMNNSTPNDGPNINGSYNPIDSMVVIGTTAYYSAGYNEGRFQLYKFALSNPYQTTGYGVGPEGTTTNLIFHISTDGTYLYALLEADAASQTPVIEKFDLNFNLLDSESVSSDYGATDIAAQPAGCQNLVFVSHAGDNKVYIYNESNLTPYSTPYLNGAALGWNTPQAVAVNSNGDLWLACKNTATGLWQVLRYTFSGGTWTLAATITGFINPIGLAVSTDGSNTLMVADGEQSGVAVDQQIKAYNNAGTTLWTLGEAGGYATNGPAVTDNKFILNGMICPQPDGSFWITDFGGGNRTMHFNSYANGLGFISDITYAASYNAAVDENNADDVFQTVLNASLVEYQINYSEPFTEGLGWTPVDNWTYLGLTNLMTNMTGGERHHRTACPWWPR